ERRNSRRAVSRRFRRGTGADRVAEQQQGVGADGVRALDRATPERRVAGRDPARRSIERGVRADAATRAAGGVEEECEDEDECERAQGQRGAGVLGAAGAVLEKRERGAGGEGEEPGEHQTKVRAEGDIRGGRNRILRFSVIATKAIS